MTEKRVKRNEQSLQEIWDYVKRPNLHSIGVPECDEENESKLENTLQDIIQENFPNLARQANIQVQEIQRTPQRYSSRRATPRHIIVRFTRVEMKEKMLRAAREKDGVTHKGKPIRLTADLSAETLQARREWRPTFNILKEKNFQPRISYPAKLSFISEGKIKFFANKQVLRDYITTRPALQELLKEALHMDGNNQYQPFQKHTKRAFEEKRKEQEEKEHQIREQILQQRRQKFEEVTEKFQRAHIPLSQRRKAVFRKPVPPLEEALTQIQESNLKSETNLPFSHRPTVHWRTIDSALPSALSKNDHKHQKQLLSKTNCDKEMNENMKATLATNKNVFQLKLEETQKLLEDQHLSSLQKFCDEVNQITNSETLSSIDSLEATEHEEIYLTLNKEHSTSIQQNIISLKSADPQSTNLSCFDEDKLAFSKAQHINNWLTNLDASNTQNVTAFSDILSKSNVLHSWECFSSKEKNPSLSNGTVERATNTANNSIGFVSTPPIFVLDKKSEKTPETSTMRTTDTTSGAFKRERPLVTESPIFKFSKYWSTLDSLTQEVAAFPDQEKYSELNQENGTTSIPTSCVPLATPLVLPSNTQSARPLAKNSINIKESDAVQCSDKLGELKDGKEEKIKYFNCHKGELPLFSDSFQDAYITHNPDSKDEKQKLADTSSLSNVTYKYDLVGQQKKMKYNIHERNGVRFLKSILKKESKYEHGYLKALILNQSFKFGSQKAAAIRDSIELTKEKGKGPEIPKTVKKLRWFDETSNIENSAEDNNSLKNKTGITQQHSQQFHIESGAGSNIISVSACAVNSADRKKSREDSVSENVMTLGGSGADHVPLNCFMPSDFNFAKHAWPASKKEESKILVHNNDSKTQQGKPQRGVAKIIRKTGSAKVQSGFLCTNRKGTVIQPQSASKINIFTQPQGKLIVPHPPQSASNIRNGENTQVSQCQSVTPENPQNIIKHNCFNLKHVLPTEHNLNQWNQESSSPLSNAYSDLVTVIPSLPSYCSSECQTFAKINHSNGTRAVAQQDGTLYCTQRSPVCEESYQSVTLRTTEEESVPLWKRGHNILHQNKRAAGSTVMRRKQIVETKRRNILEQKRQNPGSVGQKYNEQINNFGQSVQLSSSEPKQTTGGTSYIEEDSTSEFLMAENLVKASAPEDEIPTVRNSKQIQKSNLPLNKTHQFNICTLSAEEQKILESLNDLNERLHCKYGRTSLTGRFPAKEPPGSPVRLFWPAQRFSVRSVRDWVLKGSAGPIPTKRAAIGSAEERTSTAEPGKAQLCGEGAPPEGKLRNRKTSSPTSRTSTQRPNLKVGNYKDD
ncbi:Centrosomal protein of 126 kDa, partial [Plecturocebus cupreus]